MPTARLFAAALLASGLAAFAAAPAQADWHRHGDDWHDHDHAHFGVFIGGGCCYTYPYYDPYYPYYVAPPPVVYTVPPPSPVYAYPSPPSMLADQTSPTFVDHLGRTCRHFQSAAANPGEPPVTGTACLMTDGAWHAVNE
ncbi:MAG TPA: hypothetical protein VMV79_00360 [Alphaproteobacteria bacterium]|nr:hypothetical protein [Alphaproteobacteria bacterium]